jgi:hypothetical protein
LILSKGGFDLSLLRKVFFIDWIPAFAGMSAVDNFLHTIDILPHLDDETVATLRRKGRGFLLRSGVALSLP